MKNAFLDFSRNNPKPRPNKNKKILDFFQNLAPSDELANAVEAEYKNRKWSRLKDVKWW